MKISVIGLNHKTAPVDIREKLAFNAEQANAALGQMKDKFNDAEFALLSTCNRTEVYFFARNDSGPSSDDIILFLCDFCSAKINEFKEFLYIHNSDDAVRHLLTVASSLDSLVIGESQIIAQVKECYSLAAAAQSSGKVINRLFHCAFTTSKEVYTLTSITQRRVSVAGVAVELAQQLLSDVSQAQVAVIGAGEMGELLVRHLLDINCQNITVYNRTLSRAEKMAQQFNINAAPWDDLQPAMQQADIVVAAATTDDYLFDKSYFGKRRGGPLLIIDIAVPRNFDPAVNEIEEIYLYSVDDLAQVIQENIEARQEDINSAQDIIEDNVNSFMDWFGVMDIGPLIGQMRHKFHQISQAELDRFLAGEPNITPLQKQKTEAAVNRIVDKLTHRLINNFYTVAKTYGSAEAGHLIDSIINYKDRSS